MNNRMRDNQRRRDNGLAPAFAGEVDACVTLTSALSDAERTGRSEGDAAASSVKGKGDAGTGGKRASDA